MNTPVHVAAEAFVSAREALPAEVTIQDAILYFNRFNRGVERKQINAILDEYLAMRRASNVSEHYLAAVHRHLSGFGRFTAGRMLPDLKARDLDDYLQQTGLGAVSKNDAWQKIITFSNWAKGRGYLPRDWREFEGAMPPQVGRKRPLAVSRWAFRGWNRKPIRDSETSAQPSSLGADIEGKIG